MNLRAVRLWFPEWVVVGLAITAGLVRVEAATLKITTPERQETVAGVGQRYEVLSQDDPRYAGWDGQAGLPFDFAAELADVPEPDKVTYTWTFTDGGGATELAGKQVRYITAPETNVLTVAVRAVCPDLAGDPAVLDKTMVMDTIGGPVSMARRAYDYPAGQGGFAEVAPGQARALAYDTMIGSEPRHLSAMRRLYAGATPGPAAVIGGQASSTAYNWSTSPGLMTHVDANDPGRCEVFGLSCSVGQYLEVEYAFGPGANGARYSTTWRFADVAVYRVGAVQDVSASYYEEEGTYRLRLNYRLTAEPPQGLAGASEAMAYEVVGEALYPAVVEYPMLTNWDEFEFSPAFDCTGAQGDFTDTLGISGIPALLSQAVPPVLPFSLMGAEPVIHVDKDFLAGADTAALAGKLGLYRGTYYVDHATQTRVP